jgi:2-oxoisovalerate dehydrogenase E1 component
VPDGPEVVVPLGRAAVVQPGEDVTVVTYGPGVPLALGAASSGEFSLEVIDLRTVAPVDFATVEVSVAKTNRALILHEDALTGGIGAEIAALIADRCFSLLDAPVKRVAAADTHIPFAHNLEAAVLPSLAGLTTAIRELLAY